MAALFAVILLLSGFHDFWIKPSTFTPSPGDTVGVEVLIGHLADAVSYDRNPAHIERFIATHGDSLITIRGKPGDSPAGTIAFEHSGIVLLGYESRPTLNMMLARSFEGYLRESGLDHVVELRKRLGESDKEGTEAFVRSAKSVLNVGVRDGKADGSDNSFSRTLVSRAQVSRALGLPVEFIPESDPYDLRSGGTFVVRLVREGRSVVGARVEAWNGASARARTFGVTDEEGRVRLKLRGTGVWLLRSVVMLRSEKGESADWTSYWPSLTFEVSR